MTRILFSNLGYARGIDGSLKQIVQRFYRYVYCRESIQGDILKYLRTIIDDTHPDICGFVEIHGGGRLISKLNQLHALLCDNYPCFDIANKYGEDNPVRHMPLHRGRSNGFMAKQHYEFQRLYFKHGTKRLIYHVRLEDNVNLIFTHFSLNARTRQKQFNHIAAYLDDLEGAHIVMGDFNIFQGFGELDEFKAKTGLVLLNDEENHTFLFHKRKLALDLCLCSPDIAETSTLSILEQPFSDHDALLLEF